MNHRNTNLRHSLGTQVYLKNNISLASMETTIIILNSKPSKLIEFVKPYQDCMSTVQQRGNKLSCMLNIVVHHQGAIQMLHLFQTLGCPVTKYKI